MTNVEKDIEKARRKSLTEEKLKELMLKLRKNATGTLTFGKLVNVIDAIGWQIEGVLGWVSIHYPAGTNGKDKLPILTPSSRFHDKRGFEAARLDLKEKEVSRLPDEPSRLGEVVIMKVGEVRKSADYGGPEQFHFYHDEWRATEGVVVGTAEGTVSEPILHRRHDVANTLFSALSPNRLVSDVWRWMEQNGVKEAIAQALDMEVHVPAAERSRENTGTCPACWGNYKLEKGRLVMHGYQRPGYGHITGSCFCVGYPPAETSDKGIAAWHDKVLVPTLEDTQKSHEAAKGGKVDVIQTGRTTFVKRGEPRFDYHLDNMIRELKRKIDDVKKEIETYEKLMAAWKPREMPKDGELQRGLGFFLK